MGIVCIPKSVTKMDGIFGCKVVQAKDDNGNVEFLFRKKTVFDLIYEFFSKSEMRQSRSTAVKALSTIKSQLGDSASKEFKSLVTGYESNTDEIDFKKVKTALETRELRGQIKFPPMVFSEIADEERALLRHLAYESNPVEKSTDKSREDSKGCVQNIVTYRARDDGAVSALDEPSNSKKSSTQKFDNQWPAREDFETIYRERLGASIRNKNYKIEIFRDPDGVISDENLAALAETMVEIEKIIKIPFSVSIVEDDDEEYRKISARMESALLDYVADHGKPVGSAPETDFGKLKSDLAELSPQYRNERLDTRMPSIF